MTKVQLDYRLVRPLTDDDLKGISDVHSYYGMQRVKPMHPLDRLSVEYDASRLTELDVEAVLVRYGIPIERKWTVP